MSDPESIIGFDWNEGRWVYYSDFGIIFGPPPSPPREDDEEWPDDGRWEGWE